MRGLADLVALRVDGYAPAVVIVEVAHNPHRDEERDGSVLAHRPNDAIPSDLRAVVGLPVIVAGVDNKAATIRVCEAMRDAGASQVHGFYGDGVCAARLKPEERVFQWPT